MPEPALAPRSFPLAPNKSARKRGVYWIETIVYGFVILPLVFVLSGVPAAAVICDLMLCPETAKQDAATGCHDHSLPSSGKRITARADNCAHISPVDPYVTPGSGVVSQSVATAPVASISDAPVAFRCVGEPARANGPPSWLRAASALPLRI